jgi:hypothetical protein
VADTQVDPAAPPAVDPPELIADLDRLRSMVEHDDVEGARAFVKEAEQRWPDSHRVSHWARVLAPPVTRVVPGKAGRSLAREHAWLREHRREYPGCWLAVLEDRLLDADPDLGTLLARLREMPRGNEALLHFQPRPAD